MIDEITPKEEVIVEAPIEPVSEPVQAPEPQTAQIPVNEPLPSPAETSSEPEAEPITETIPEETKPEPEIQSESIPESVTEEVKPEISEPIKPEPISESKSEPKPIPEIIPAIAIISKSKSLARELLVKARNMIQFRKRKKLDKIMTLFAKQTKITNDEVEKFLHVSDATATRYLNTLEKENKIKQSGKTGKSVFYSKL
jgi:hypothetical protein